MAVFSRIKNWVSNEVLTASDLNAEYNNILTNMQPSGIEDQSADVAAMQATANPGTVGSESLATTLAGEIQRLRYKIKEILGTAQWYSAPTRTLAAGSLSVATADLQAGSVTQAKREALPYQLSSSSGSFSTTSTSYVDATNLSVSITTTGRPVFATLVPVVDTTNGSGLFKQMVTAAGSEVFLIKLVRGSTDAGIARIQVFGSSGYQDEENPSIVFIDTPAAGTYTYKIQVKSNGGDGLIGLSRLKLFVYEM